MQLILEGYDPDDERRRESLLALGNGVLFLRGSPPEARRSDEHHYAGTYRAGCYDRQSHRTDGSTFGHDSLVNLPNGLRLTFRAAGESEWFSLRECEVLEYRQTLHMEPGIVQREARFRDPRGRHMRLEERRLVSMARPMLLALRLSLTPEGWSGPIEILSVLDADVDNRNTDPALEGCRHLGPVDFSRHDEDILALETETRHSRIRLALAARTVVEPLAPAEIVTDPDRIAQRFLVDLRDGEAVHIEKVAAVGSVLDPAAGNPTEAAAGAIAAAPGFEALGEEHARSWKRLWQRVGIKARDQALQMGLCFHAFHILQTVSPHTTQLNVGLPSRGLQEAYHGQIFWDEIFAFPFLDHRFPEIARSLLLYRYRRLPQARQAAQAAGYAGAMFPWRSASTGAEETPGFQFNPLNRQWSPDRTYLQRHIGAAISHNIWHYYLATDDASFLAEYGAEMLVEIARFWASIARHAPADDRYDITGVVGPDEYHTAYPGAADPGLDNNSYTNIMAALSLRRAAAALARLPGRRRHELMGALNLSEEEIDHWGAVARRLRLCFNRDGVISQFAGFEDLQPFDGRSYARQHPDSRVDWELAANGEEVNAYQVTKQADVLVLLYLLPPDELIDVVASMGYHIDLDCLRRTASYYLQCMTHESSLSRIVCAGALAKLDLDASWAFFEGAVCIDFDIANSAKAEEGLHLGAMAASLDVLQRHYLGIETRQDGLSIAPSLPQGLGPIALRLQYQELFFGLDWDGAVLRLESDAANGRAITVYACGSKGALAPGEVLQVYPAPEA